MSTVTDATFFFGFLAMVCCGLHLRLYPIIGVIMCAKWPKHSLTLFTGKILDNNERLETIDDRPYLLDKDTVNFGLPSLGLLAAGSGSLSIRRLSVKGQTLMIQ